MGAALAAPAPAAGRIDRIALAPTASVTGGPVFAGSRLARVESRGSRDRVVAAGRTVARFRSVAHPSFALDASGERVAVVRTIAQRYAVYRDAFSGPLGGPLAERSRCGGRPELAVSGRVVAERCRTEVVIRAPGRPAQRVPIEADAPIALAGPFLAHRTRDAVVVVDWARGAERLRLAVPEAAGGQAGLDLDADGTVVFAAGPGLWWASVADPVARPLPLPGGSARVRRGRVAVAVSLGGGPATIHVLTLAGERVGSVAGVPADAWDFDGRRLVYAVRPCALASIVTLDPAHDAAPRLGTRCGRTSVRREPLRVGRDGRVTLTFGCPRAATAGCGEWVELCLPAMRALCGYAEYGLRAGETRRVRPLLDRALLRQLRAMRRPALVVGLSGRSGFPLPVRLRSPGTRTSVR